MENLKIAVVGYGHLGRWHCQKVQAIEKVVLYAIVEPSAQAQEAAKGAHPQARVVMDIDEVLMDIDAVFIVTPTSTHFDLVKKVLQANKHCFCEKPMTSTFDQAKQLQKLQRDNLILQVGHSERFHQVWESLRLDTQEVSKPITLTVNRYAPFKGRATDVDVVQDLMIHDIDLMLYLTKIQPHQVWATGHKSVSEHWDYVKAWFQGPGGVGVFTVGRAHVKEVRSFEISCAKGCFFIDLLNTQYARFHANSSRVQAEAYEKRDHLLMEHLAFYDSIFNAKSALVGYRDGLQAVYLVEKVLESLDKGKSLELDLALGC